MISGHVPCLIEEKLFAATKTNWRCSSVCVARLVAMRDRDLAQAERLITECNNRIARQREVIANAFQIGHDTEVAISMLRAFEASLQAFEKHRQLVRAQQKRAALR
jgi:hypothetical protein